MGNVSRINISKNEAVIEFTDLFPDDIDESIKEIEKRE